MGTAAIALAILGLMVGALFRLKILLAFIGAVLIVSVIYSAICGFTFLETAMTVLIGQIILQSSYFLGLVFAATLAGSDTIRPHVMPRR